MPYTTTAGGPGLFEILKQRKADKAAASGAAPASGAPAEQQMNKK